MIQTQFGLSPQSPRLEQSLSDKAKDNDVRAFPVEGHTLVAIVIKLSLVHDELT